MKGEVGQLLKKISLGLRHGFSELFSLLFPILLLLICYNVCAATLPSRSSREIVVVHHTLTGGSSVVVAISVPMAGVSLPWPYGRRLMELIDLPFHGSAPLPYFTSERYCLVHFPEILVVAKT